jgi:hypothetical protein
VHNFGDLTVTINEIVVRHVNENADVARISCVYQKNQGDVITMSDDLNVVNAVKNFILTHVEHAILKSKYHDIRFK